MYYSQFKPIMSYIHDLVERYDEFQKVSTIEKEELAALFFKYDEPSERYDFIYDNKFESNLIAGIVAVIESEPDSATDLAHIIRKAIVHYYSPVMEELFNQEIDPAIEWYPYNKSHEEMESAAFNRNRL